MAKAYVTQLMELFETKIAMVIEWQNPDYADRLALMQLQLGQLAQARDKCDFETQLYCVNRLATLMETLPVGVCILDAQGGLE